MPVTRLTPRRIRFDPMLPPPDPLTVSSGFIGGRRAPPPPPLPPDVIEIEETQPEGPRRKGLTPFPMPSPPCHEGQGAQIESPEHGPSHKGQGAQTKSPEHSPSHKGQGTQTDPQLRKVHTPNFPDLIPCASCAINPYVAHHAPHPSCMTHAPYIAHASCAINPYVAHHTPHPPCMTHAPYIPHASCTPPQATLANTMKQIAIHGRSLAQMIQEAREDGYREAMEHVAKRMDDEFNWEE